MQLLLVHQNFPGQFKHLAPALVKQGHQVSALMMAQAPSLPWQGVQQHSYWPGRGSSPNHPPLGGRSWNQSDPSAILP